VAGLAVVVAAMAFACGRPRAPHPAQVPASHPTPAATPSATAPAVVDLEPEAAQLRARVLEALPSGSRWEVVGAEPRREGALRWRHARYRVWLPAGANLKAATGSVVKAAEDAGGVLLASRPVEGGQVLELGVEHGGRVLPVVQVRVESPPKPVKGAGARVAVVLDDAGMRLEELDRVLRIGRPVTLAILPGLPHSQELARRAREAGVDVLLHLPMEPEDPSLARLLGEFGVRVDMSEEEIGQTVRAALRAVPGAVGVNNHMGSRATADPRVVGAVLRVVREEGLFFLDSRSTPRSSVEAVAKNLGVRTAHRSVFLDNDPSPEAVRGQVRRLAELALREGSAVGIGHANRPHTPEVLAEMAAELEQRGVQLVPLRELVR
jgi:polysaccharide deacetylase 2 family uncharacterized protein YibQ